MSAHTVRAFTEELERLTADLMRMGGLAEAMVRDACAAVARADAARCAEIIARDEAVDRLEMDIERRITRMLALRQPLATDLREVLAALKISHNLERIGDLAKNIAKRAGGLEGADEIIGGVGRMGAAVSAQMQAVLDAYAARNAEAALQVWRADDDIDHHYTNYFREVLTAMVSRPDMVAAGAHVLFIAKNLERIGDHCTNIAEVVHFRVTGEYLAAAERPKVQELES